MDSLTASNNQFAIEFNKMLSESEGDGNILFSPLDISTALSMTLLGARGNTATQIEQVLQLHKVTAGETTSPRFEKKRKMELNPNKAEGIFSDFQAHISEINKPNNSYMLKTANRLYGEKSYPFHCEYLENMKKYFGAEPQSVNFLEDAEQIRTQINSWVENETEGKIVKLLPDDSIDSMTRLVLVNVIYFKGKWKEQFKPEDTTEKPFRVNQNQGIMEDLETTTKPVKMMSMKCNLQIFHIEKPDAKGIQLYYGNGEISMFIVLPDDVNGLKELEKTITYGKLSDWTHEDMMEMYDVQLYLPKFKLEKNYDLKSTLITMGMSDAFSTSHADFSGMTDRKNLFLSEVFHKSFIEVNEEGTEATASTADDFSVRIRLPSITFNVDHPFLFFIKHNKTNSILFYGRFCSP